MAYLQKRSVTLSGHGTSIALEAEFWRSLQQVAVERGWSLSTLIRSIDEGRDGRPLASACRLAVLAWALDRRG